MTQKIGRFRVEKGRQVGRSKISENRRTSLMDVPLSNIGHHCLQCPNGPAILFILEIWVIFWFFYQFLPAFIIAFVIHVLIFKFFGVNLLGKIPTYQQNQWGISAIVDNKSNARQQIGCYLVFTSLKRRQRNINRGRSIRP